MNEFSPGNEKALICWRMFPGETTAYTIFVWLTPPPEILQDVPLWPSSPLSSTPAGACVCLCEEAVLRGGLDFTQPWLSLLHDVYPATPA